MDRPVESRYILKKKGCNRADCFPCTTGSGNCEKNLSRYRITCERCLGAGKSSEYEGETGANGFTRGKEQANGLRLEEEKNALWKHCPIELVEVVGSFQSAMARQVNKRVRIQRSKADCKMNSKNEFQ